MNYKSLDRSRSQILRALWLSEPNQIPTWEEWVFSEIDSTDSNLINRFENLPVNNCDAWQEEIIYQEGRTPIQVGRANGLTIQHGYLHDGKGNRVLINTESRKAFRKQVRAAFK